uniref:Uncharacterized protein n=1 Tax=Sphaerodactylus townsendi TaxID=933632 RepID=A0ACB8FTC9_9SAUR
MPAVETLGRACFLAPDRRRRTGTACTRDGSEEAGSRAPTSRRYRDESRCTDSLASGRWPPVPGDMLWPQFPPLLLEAGARAERRRSPQSSSALACAPRPRWTRWSRQVGRRVACQRQDVAHESHRASKAEVARRSSQENRSASEDIKAVPQCASGALPLFPDRGAKRRSVLLRAIVRIRDNGISPVTPDTLPCRECPVKIGTDGHPLDKHSAYLF